MKENRRLNYHSRHFSLYIQPENGALLVKLKGTWLPETFDKYASVLGKFLSYIDTNEYTLIIHCAEFKISIPELRGIVTPFLKTYRDAGFKIVKIVTENPQYEFRRMVKTVGLSLGFEMEFTNHAHIPQKVYIYIV
jgi:hypothetical protein